MNLPSLFHLANCKHLAMRRVIEVEIHWTSILGKHASIASIIEASVSEFSFSSIVSTHGSLVDDCVCASVAHDFSIDLSGKHMPTKSY